VINFFNCVNHTINFLVAR